MSDEKIKISWDELNSANNNHAGQTTYIPPPQATSQSYIDSSSSANKDNTPWLIAGIIGAIVVLVVLFFVCKMGMEGKETLFHRQTVDEWCAKAREELNRELAKPDCPVRRRIENAHLTVDVRYAKIISLTAQTLDGTNYSNDGKNIASYNAKVEFTWDGVFQKGGYSILEIMYDIQNDKLLKTDISQTNAMFNIEDPNFWFDVGWGIGALLAL